jgi:large subunit ribosomal protein L16
MLQSKPQKHRKQFRGKMTGLATANNHVDFGDYGIKTIERGWINAREIEATRRAIVGYTKRKGKVWTKIFPFKPFTQKPNNSKMLGGKGDVEGYVAVVKPGVVMFEIGGVSEEVAMEALRLGSNKLSVMCKIVKKREI